VYISVHITSLQRAVLPPTIRSQYFLENGYLSFSFEMRITSNASMVKLLTP